MRGTPPSGGGWPSIVLESGHAGSPWQSHRCPASATSGYQRDPVVENLAILVVLAALAGAFVLVVLNTLWRMESRAHWHRDAGIERSQRRERRVFMIGVGVVLVMGALLLVGQLLRRPSCTGKIVIVKGPDGAPVECLCEQGRRGVCFPAGP